MWCSLSMADVQGGTDCNNLKSIQARILKALLAGTVCRLTDGQNRIVAKGMLV
ncbi:hypothetical protein PsAD37_01142 [Pseudovibrio sp. Ad37]|nr:hypothetical protein PsWM33_04044 [Pseudovibrio sp. WM33]KZL27704.1 hypothetical protein PsAD37_01142 [Pseudovibrio sp. Ad37]